MKSIIAFILAHKAEIIAAGGMFLTMAISEYIAANPASPYNGILRSILAATGKAQPSAQAQGEPKK